MALHQWFWQEYKAAHQLHILLNSMRIDAHPYYYEIKRAALKLRRRRL